MEHESEAAAVPVVSSDRGLCGAFITPTCCALRELIALLRQEGDTDPVRGGRKALSCFRLPQLEHHRIVDRVLREADLRTRLEIAGALVQTFLAGADDEGDDPACGQRPRVDELHIVYRIPVDAVPERRGAPDRPDGRRVRRGGRDRAEDPVLFEPDATTLFDNLLPRYVTTGFTPRCWKRRRRRNRHRGGVP